MKKDRQLPPLKLSSKLATMIDEACDSVQIQAASRRYAPRAMKMAEFQREALIHLAAAIEAGTWTPAVTANVWTVNGKVV